MEARENRKESYGAAIYEGYARDISGLLQYISLHQAGHRARFEHPSDPTRAFIVDLVDVDAGEPLELAVDSKIPRPVSRARREWAARLHHRHPTRYAQFRPPSQRAFRRESRSTAVALGKISSKHQCA